MDYSIDLLYSYSDDRGEIKRYLVSLINDDNELRNIEIEVINNNLIELIERESDELSEDEETFLYYVIDNWTINHLIQ